MKLSRFILFVICLLNLNISVAYSFDSKGESEISIPENLTYWVFEDGTFIPMAKLQGDKSYSIITDHLGTPTECYDQEGQKVWSRELGIYGQTRKESGVGNFVPFKYQGQYEDFETRLCYNRFRYYSPESGTYLSQDPIRMNGNNPNIYAYVSDSNAWVDVFGLSQLVVIGEGMGRVQGLATALDAHEIGSVWDSSKPAMKQNREWIDNLIADKAVFVDVGTDGRPKPSSFYEMEIRQLKKAGYVPLDVSKVKGMHGNKIPVPKGTKMWVPGCK